jgi:ANTAR domain
LTISGGAGVDLLSAQADTLIVLLSATADVVDDFADEMKMLREEVSQLRGAMEARAPIEQARGTLMMRCGLSADRALHLLRSSRTQSVELRALAVVAVNLGIDEGRVGTHGLAPGPAGPGLGSGRATAPSSLGSSDATDVCQQ